MVYFNSNIQLALAPEHAHLDYLRNMRAKCTIGSTYCHSQLHNIHQRNTRAETFNERSGQISPRSFIIRAAKTTTNTSTAGLKEGVKEGRRESREWEGGGGGKGSEKGEEGEGEGMAMGRGGDEGKGVRRE